MKFFIVFTCALAAASASYVHPVVYGAQHLPVIGANGVPVDTAEVQHARAAHDVHKIDALVRNGDLVNGIVAAPIVSAPVVSAYSAPVVSAHSAPIVSSHGAHLGVSTISHIGGHPIDTAEVAIAKANHLAAHNSALVHNVHSAVLLRHRRGIYGAAHPVVYGGPQNIPIIGAEGVPVEPIEVQHARAAHLIAKAQVQARGHVSAAPIVAHGASILAHAAPAIAYSAPVAIAAPQHLPIIGANGVPVDTAEVQHARAAHLAHKVEAHARNGDLAVVSHAVPAVAYSNPIAYAAHHVPTVAHGVPVDTIEVQHAKAAHFAAHAKAALHAHY